MKALALALQLALPAAGAEPDPEAMLRRYDDIMGPEHFEGELTVVAHRADGSTRSRELRVWKSGKDKLRASSSAPADARGQEILRVGDDCWAYRPDLKKPVRVGARESFMGGDFNNADVLRVNLGDDYTASIQKETTEAWVLELKSRTSASSYDRILLTLRKEDGMPLAGRYFAASGREVRSAEFKDVRPFRGHARPARVVMKNLVEPARWSELVVRELRPVKGFPSRKFALTELGK